MAGLALAAFLGFGGLDPQRLDLWHRLTGPQIDGSWKFQTIDGTSVAQQNFTVEIRWGSITSGRDDCNSWWRSSGEGASIVTTLVACEDSALRSVYNKLARGPFTRASAMSLSNPDRLIITNGAHSGTLSRSDT